MIFKIIKLALKCRLFRRTSSCKSWDNYVWLTAHTWQKWKRVFLTCLCHKIYRDEAVGLKSCIYTRKISIFVKMWNLGQSVCLPLCCDCRGCGTVGVFALPSWACALPVPGTGAVISWEHGHHALSVWLVSIFDLILRFYYKYFIL